MEHDLTYAQKSIIGYGGYFSEDAGDVMEIMRSGRWNLERIITHEFSIDDIDKVIQTAADSNHAFNVIIRF